VSPLQGILLSLLAVGLVVSAVVIYVAWKERHQ
jgi:hypothetical protein